MYQVHYLVFYVCSDYGGSYNFTSKPWNTHIHMYIVLTSSVVVKEDLAIWFHLQLQGFIKREMKRNDITAPLANDEVVFFVVWFYLYISSFCSITLKNQQLTSLHNICYISGICYRYVPYNEHLGMVLITAPIKEACSVSLFKMEMMLPALLSMLILVGKYRHGWIRSVHSTEIHFQSTSIHTVSSCILDNGSLKRYSRFLNFSCLRQALGLGQISCRLVWKIHCDMFCCAFKLFSSTAFTFDLICNNLDG